ncbi:MAG: sensor histidine kinase [Oscillatoriales cyanobacterium]|nr:MAG: sensor histidine kinase [Oscillatoriales cyanobacterium]
MAFLQASDTAITPSELLPELRKCCCDHAAFERLLKLLLVMLPPDHDPEFHAVLIEAISGAESAAYSDIADTPDRVDAINTKNLPSEQVVASAALGKGNPNQSLQSERLMTLGQLMAGTAHEINNPVSFVYGNLVHLQQYIQDLINILEQYRQQLKSIDSDRSAKLQILEQEMDLEFLLEDLPKTAASMRLGLERVRTIVNSLKNFSRTDDHQPKMFNLNDSLTSSLLILHHRLKMRSDGITIQVIENYANLPPVECFIGQINQVFINILGNAIDALEEYQLGTAFQPTITLKTVVHDSGDRVVISIADNGPGIPETIQAQLFDRFFTTKPLGKGTGLGLSIVQEIITQNHDGQVICHSTAAGTTFEISLPLRHRLMVDG